MKPIRLIRLLSLFVLSVLPHFGTAECKALPRLPEPEPTWKNINVQGKKTTVFSMFRDSHGIMWLGSNNGLFFYDGVTVHPVGEKELAGAQIYGIVERSGRLYLGGNNGLHIYDYETGTVTPGTSALPREIRTLQLHGDELWVGSLYGIYMLDMQNGAVTDFSSGLPHKSVYSILRDSRGILYVGTYNGLARWSTGAKKFRSVKSDSDNRGLRNLFVNSLLESTDGEHIYIGSEGSLYDYSPITEKWTKVMALEGNNIKSLAHDKHGHILIGTDNGLFDWYGATVRHYRHDSRHELSLSDNEIWCIFADDDHNIWAGHERGISIASNSNTIRTVKLSTLAHSGEGNEIHSIYRDSHNNLWLGGTNGVIKLTDSPTPDWYRHSNSATSLSHNRIRSIGEDSGHNIWLSTDGGLNRYNTATNGFDVYHVVDSKGEHNSNWVYSFVEDNDYYWVGSFLGGLHRVHKSKFTGTGGTVVSDFSLNTDSKTSGKGDIGLANDLVNNMIIDNDGNVWILLFRDNLLTKYTPSQNRLEKYDINDLAGAYPTHICLDDRGRIWCAFKGGVIVFDQKGGHRIVKFPYTYGDESVLAIGKVDDSIWISTLSNVWSIDCKSLKASILPIPQKPYTAIYEDVKTGKVLLGGTDEILEVDYRGLAGPADYKTIKLVLRDRGNGQLDMSDIDGYKRGINLPYGGGISMFVSSLDYSPEAPRRYMYKLAESKADTTDGWIVLPEGSNRITLSDLKTGDYILMVKTVGSPVSATMIPLTVQPPLALSWWALCIYALVAIGVIVWIILYMRRRNSRVMRERERQTALENVEKKLSFLSSISHDLKTPLSMILGPVSIMKERAKDPDNKKNLEIVYENAVRLNNMIHRTLELQHLEADGINLLIESTFDVVSFCKSIFEVFRDNNPHKKFIFHSMCSRQLIEADAVKLESVMTNLLSNACKYSDDGATISCGIVTDGDKIEIMISDDGVGIADIDQPLVFQRMFRSPSTSKLHEGTGLGLYLIKKYLELMNGNIALYSKEGQGTTFVVSLPISEKALPEASNETGDVSDGKAKILIVEDNLQISGFISDILKDEFTCFMAENGRAGLSIAASIIPDLIIVDEMMPIMSGLELVRHLKQNPRLAAIPIIMLTAKSDNTTENESIKLGVDVFMGKPFEASVLMGRINHILKTRSELKEKVRIQAIAEAESKPIEAESVNEKTLARIAKVIEENISDLDLNVNLLCEKTGIPNKQLYRLIKKYMGIAPLDYIRRVRLQKAAVLLSQHRFTVSEISYMVGFNTPSYFAKCFQAHYGVKPSHYQSEDESVNHK